MEPDNRNREIEMKKSTIVLAAVALVAAVALWAASGCCMLNQGPAPAGHEMHQTGVESQVGDY